MARVYLGSRVLMPYFSPSELEPMMSTDAGPRKFEMEKAAIDEAYCRQIKDLFSAFHFATCKAAEKNALAKFKADLDALRRAHIQALSIFSDHHQM